MPLPRELRKLLAFGTGIGVEVGSSDLEIVAARVRPNRVQVAGHLLVRNFAGRPAAGWGAEYGHFLKSLAMGHMSATVLLPRREVIVRQVPLPGVAAREMENAIRFQLDTLHPFGEDEVAWSARARLWWASRGRRPCSDTRNFLRKRAWPWAASPSRLPRSTPQSG